MKIRAELHLGSDIQRVILAAKPEEKADHLALKLAAFAMFHEFRPTVEPSAQHPALLGMDIRPDLFFLNEAGDISTWIECGEVSINKLDKLTRRLPQTRIVVLKTTKHQADRLRITLGEQVRMGARIEIWTWPDNEFKTWLHALEEKTEIFGEAHEKSFNLVVNQTPIAVDLVSS
jgi:uncharacterized protein YaeQ